MSVVESTAVFPLATIAAIPSFHSIEGKRKGSGEDHRFPELRRYQRDAVQ